MPLRPPPEGRRAPVLESLDAGSSVYRLHTGRYAPVAFAPADLPAPRGGRFDASDGSYRHLYAAKTIDGAVVERLLRGDSPARTAARLLPRVALKDLQLSRIRLEAALPLVQLHGAGLAAVNADALLTSCDETEYDTSRRWAVALRQWAPDAAGLVWRARHDNDQFVYVLFSDRVSDGTLVAEQSLPIASGLGLVAVRRALARYNVTVAPDTTPATGE